MCFFVPLGVNEKVNYVNHYRVCYQVNMSFAEEMLVINVALTTLT